MGNILWSYQWFYWCVSVLIATNNDEGNWVSVATAAQSTPHWDTDWKTLIKIINNHHVLLLSSSNLLWHKRRRRNNKNYWQITKWKSQICSWPVKSLLSREVSDVTLNTKVHSTEDVHPLLVVLMSNMGQDPIVLISNIGQDPFVLMSNIVQELFVLMSNE